MIPLGLLLAGVALAQPRDDLEAGDEAWFEGDRRGARRAWKLAAAGDDHAVAAQAEVRLLLVSGNLGLALHGPRADRALAACPPADPWCALAAADYYLLTALLGMPALPGAAVAAAARVQGELPAAAAARLVWAGVGSAAELSGDDALSEGLRSTGGAWPSGPGTWSAGLGVVAAPGLGVGASLRFVHPDLLWRAWKLQAVLGGTSRGSLSASAQVTTPGEIWWAGGATAAHTVVDVYTVGFVQTWTVDVVEGTWTPGLHAGDWYLWGGPVARWDDDGAIALRGHGIRAGAGWSDRAADGTGASARAATEISLGDYWHVERTVDLRGVTDAPVGQLAGRLFVQGAPGSQAPEWRLPSAGGLTVLRGAPDGRYRGERLVAVALESRHQLRPMVQGVLFAEIASVDGTPHPGFGAGLRLALPPQPSDAVRLDLGITDAGWGFVVGWGQAF